MIRLLQGRATTKQNLIAVGVLAISVLVLVTFYPVLKIGFLGDDWWEVANVGRKTLPEFLRFYFDPTVQTIWYRPLHGLLLLFDYNLFGANPEGYRLVQLLIHLGSSLLVMLIVYQFSTRWRLAFVAAMLYAVIYPGSGALFGIAVHDPLAMLFYLATVSLWIAYLKSRRGKYYWLAVITFVLAMMGKETSVALIVILFLLDWIIVSHPSLRDSLHRYGIFALLLLVYLVIEYRVQIQGHFANRAGYIFGLNMVENVFHYLGLLVMPWDMTTPTAWIGLLLLLALFAGLFIKPRPQIRGDLVILFAIQILLVIAPVLGFQTQFFESRYLYPASMIPAIVVAWLFEFAWARGRGRAYPRLVMAIICSSIVLLTLLHSASSADAATNLAEANRELRVPFRDITQQHPSYPPDTYVYFINPPYLLQHAAPSMFFFRYGTGITVWSMDPQWWGTIDDDRFARWRDHQNPVVYYYDDAGQRHEIAVAPNANTSSTLALPLKFQAPIRLEGYEVTSTQFKRGDMFVLLLYWRAIDQIDKDYTIFVHLVDSAGRQIAGEDSMPHSGQTPTSSWKLGQLIVDAHALTLPADAPLDNNYHMEVGLYYLPTMERLATVDGNGQPSSDMLLIQPFSVTE